MVARMQMLWSCSIGELLVVEKNEHESYLHVKAASLYALSKKSIIFFLGDEEKVKKKDS